MLHTARIESGEQQSLIESGLYEKDGITAILTVDSIVASRLKCRVHIPEGTSNTGNLEDPFFITSEEWNSLKKVPPVGDIRINRDESHGFLGIYQMNGYFMEDERLLISYIVTTPDDRTAFGSETISVWSNREQYYFEGEKLAGNVVAEVVQILSEK